MDREMMLSSMYLRVETKLEEWPCGCRKNTARTHDYQICVGYTERLLKEKISSLDSKLAIAKEALIKIQQFNDKIVNPSQDLWIAKEALSKLNEEET